MANAKLNEAQQISSMAELERLRADRENDAEHLKAEHPRPSWAAETEHPHQMHMRMRERRISFLEKRLGVHQDQARGEFERTGRQAEHNRTREEPGTRP